MKSLILLIILLGLLNTAISDNCALCEKSSDCQWHAVCIAGICWGNVCAKRSVLEKSSIKRQGCNHEFPCPDGEPCINGWCE